MKRAFLLLGVLVALGISLSGSATAANAAPTATQRLEALDLKVLAALNETRAKHGLRPLVMSDELQAAAVAHSRGMLVRGFFAHDVPGGASFAARVRDFYRSAGYESWAVGENLLYSTAEITADRAIAAWMASPGHRENILTPGWREVGIGSLHASSAGGLFGGEPTWVITTDFGARSGKIVTKQKIEQVATRKVKPKPGAKTAAKSPPGAKKGQLSGFGKQSTSRSGAAKPAPKKRQMPGPIDRVLPRPSQNSADDGANAADEPSAAPEADGGDEVTDLDDPES